ncbi:MAG: TlyA family RNA methyltransferase [Acidobacteriota bacterium]|jgi:23S rRNA (cytidine1920-2'-O)/16S rRNA (cytidine1409-2'-O)-methyltransferase|nr:TlyA family RNA methyltransferase [Acidobacteriota bacterium]
MKRRIDQILTERGFAESRHKAQALLLAGQVMVGGQKVEKPGKLVDDDVEIRLLRQLRFVSRAGAKLEAALDHFHVDVAGLVCADLGASTGGFTDCLLQRGALRVYAYDVGKGQLAWKLQSDARVVVRDGCNVRNLTGADLPEELSFVCMDLSFISLSKILAPLVTALEARFADSGQKTVDVVALVKPQFEAGRGEIGKGGIVRDPEVRRRTLEDTASCAAASGYKVLDAIPSPLPGAEGNLEFLLHLQWIKD